MNFTDTNPDNSIDKHSSISLLERVTPLARQINCLDINVIADICIKSIPELINVRLASLYILDEESNILHLHSHNHPFLINKIVSLNQTPASPMILAVKSREMICVRDIDTHNKPVIRRSQRAFAQNYKTNNCAIVPLVCQEKVVGVLNLADMEQENAFDSSTIALIELFSQLVGASIGNIKLFEKMQKQATTDGLTGLVNHKTFYDVLEKELWRSRRYGGEIILMMVDIDNLKKINDVYGHRAGDKAIREIGLRIKECVRQIDTAARYGGDEFAVILINTTMAGAQIVAKRMVEVVANSPATWKKEQIPLSISVGLARYDGGATPEDITSKSDKALYMAKQSGKNNVKVFESQNSY